MIEPVSGSKDTRSSAPPPAAPENAALGRSPGLGEALARGEGVCDRPFVHQYFAWGPE